MASSIFIPPPDSLESLLEMVALSPTIVPRRVSIGSGASVGILIAPVPVPVLVVFSGTLPVLVFFSTLSILSVVPLSVLYILTAVCNSRVPDLELFPLARLELALLLRAADCCSALLPLRPVLPRLL